MSANTRNDNASCGVGGDDPTEIVVYGTLRPGESRWHHLERWVTATSTVDTIDADLYDTGNGYPAVITSGDPRYRGGVTVGEVFSLHPHTIDAALEHLDQVEGAVGGLYERVVATTHGGRRVWLYQYGDGLTLTPISSGDWLHYPTGNPSHQV